MLVGLYFFLTHSKKSSISEYCHNGIRLSGDLEK